MVFCRRFFYWLWLPLLWSPIHDIDAQQSVEKEYSIIWNEVTSLQPTMIALPEDHKSEDQRSLIIALHGYGSTAESFMSLSDSFTKAGFIFVAPEAPYKVVFENGTQGFEWFRYDISSYIMLERPASELEKTAMRLTTEQHMGRLLDDLNTKFNVDKIFFLGFSQGGIISYLAGIHHHQNIDGIIIFSSVVDKDWLGADDIQQAKSLRALIIQGLEDKAVPIALAEESRDLLIDNGFAVTYKIFKGGHAIPREFLGYAIDWINLQ